MYSCYNTDVVVVVVAFGAVVVFVFLVCFICSSGFFSLFPSKINSFQLYIVHIPINIRV